MRTTTVGNLVSFMISVLLGTSRGLVEQFKITHSNKCSSTNSMFRILYDKSLRECVFECDIQPKCKAVNYRQRYFQCELLETDYPTNFEPTSDHTKPCVYIKKKHMYMDASKSCGQSCRVGQVCHTETGTCIIKECPPLSLANGVILGNMYNVGAILKTKGNAGFIEIDDNIYTTCNTSGQWDPKIMFILDINECESNPCQNAAACTDGKKRFTCTCAPGWTGTSCTTDIDECSSNPCQNGATCINGLNQYTCTCAPGWTGTFCTINITPKAFHTINVYNYLYIHNNGVDVTDKESVTFTVRSCNDAHIALSSTHGDPNSETYELVIGGWGNAKSVIRDCKQCPYMATRSAVLLSCNEARPFWISWSGGLIAIGTGNEVGNSQLMSWNDPTPHEVNYIAISSGYGADGDWIF